MSIAGRINLLIAVLAVAAGAVLVFFIAHREYAYRQDELVLEASTAVASQPHLQLTLYYRGPQDIAAALDQFLALSPAVRHVVLRDSVGDVIARRNRPWAEGDPLPRFSEARDRVPPLEKSILRYESELAPPVLEVAGRLLGGEEVASLALPVTSVVNPTTAGLSREDFGRVLANPEQVNSIFVIGYVEIGISTLTLWARVLPTVPASSGMGLLVVALCALAAAFSTRRITAPLGQLAAVADDIAAGKDARLLRIRGGGGEVSDIANVLNAVIAGVDSEKRRLHADRTLMSRKVSERDAQLTRRQEELEQAAQRVSHSRQRLRHLTYYDPLTALPNRRLFNEQLGLLLRLAKRSGHLVGLLLLDLDHFGRVNDALGHQAGDQLLREVADRIAGSVRGSDVLHRNAAATPLAGAVPEAGADRSRAGGDEFTVVLNELDDLRGASVVAERIIAVLSAPCSVEGQEVVLRCSIGIAVAPQHAEDMEGLLRTAGAAMLEAKQGGRNRFLFYDNRMDGAEVEQLQSETELRKVAKLDELLSRYQAGGRQRRQ